MTSRFISAAKRALDRTVSNVSSRDTVENNTSLPPVSEPAKGVVRFWIVFGHPLYCGPGRMSAT